MERVRRQQEKSRDNPNVFKFVDFNMINRTQYEKNRIEWNK